jgi:hypothetical protein
MVCFLAIIWNCNMPNLKKFSRISKNLDETIEIKDERPLLPIEACFYNWRILVLRKKISLLAIYRKPCQMTSSVCKGFHFWIR